MADGESRIRGHRGYCGITLVIPAAGAMIQPGDLHGLQRWRTEPRILTFRGAMLQETAALPDGVHRRCP